MSTTSESEVTPTAQKCIICSEVPSDKIVKDDNYMKMMSLYWQGIGLDVKPKENKNFNLCISCFEDLIEFYEANDICIFFEHSLAAARNSVLRKNLKGILKLRESNEPLSKLQSLIQKKWGTKLEPGDANDNFKGYDLKSYIESEKEDQHSSNPSSERVISTRGATDDGSQKSKVSEETAEKPGTSPAFSKGGQNLKRKRISSTSESVTDELSTTSLSSDSSTSDSDTSSDSGSDSGSK